MRNIHIFQDTFDIKGLLRISFFLRNSKEIKVFSELQQGHLGRLTKNYIQIWKWKLFVHFYKMKTQALHVSFWGHCWLASLLYISTVTGRVSRKCYKTGNRSPQHRWQRWRWLRRPAYPDQLLRGAGAEWLCSPLILAWIPCTQLPQSGSMLTTPLHSWFVPTHGGPILGNPVSQVADSSDLLSSIYFRVTHPVTGSSQALLLSP